MVHGMALKTNVIGFILILWVVIFKIQHACRFICCNYFILLLDSNRIVYVTSNLCNVNQNPKM